MHSSVLRGEAQQHKVNLRTAMRNSGDDSSGDASGGGGDDSGGDDSSGDDSSIRLAWRRAMHSIIRLTLQGAMHGSMRWWVVSEQRKLSLAGNRATHHLNNCDTAHPYTNRQNE